MERKIQILSAAFMDNPPDHGCGPGEGRPHHAALARPQLGR